MPDAREGDDQGAGDQGQEPAERQQQPEAHQPHCQGEGVDLVEVAQDVSELLEEVPGPLADPEQVGDLTDDDRQGQADDEALQHRLRRSEEHTSERV